ncbi:NAD-dependent epimerase/dehydratase family protein [Labrys wisconsinensis]|uniref:Nucleoside-diphosphate-sugar epimerase n=1 Tax=Labrys wisconsinensis TaxID=425677 RepID=A0ABU0JLM2_9HYPH|nr:NAD-dependent epimerase/dehydratase family protein [Labrys wisconsinensis]MDQ0475190.1 nucleoside-diphosphate-sugar epimerase [Labrys wisconsinensis]
MALYVVVGAGPVGRETARLLAAAGHGVKLVSRSGTMVEGADGVALDARDAPGLAAASAGAEAIVMCAMAPYHRWPAEFPPIMDGVVVAAERVGARLLVAGNVYGYGEGAPSPLTAAAPLAPTTVKGRVRAAMWQRARASAVPAIEVRASDYLGQGAGSLFTLMALPRLIAGEPAPVVGDPDAIHAWTFTRDVARTLVAASRFEGDWARAFHVPSQHASIRELAIRFAERAGAPPPDLRVLSDAELDGLARQDEIMREVAEMAYLYRRPCLLDAAETERLLDVTASSLDQAIDDTLAREG